MKQRGDRPRVILLAGPTASGKSALALKLADDVGGEIVNADSMQVYRDLRILTARPRPADEAQVPHRLYGHVKASQAYSVGRFVAEAAQAIAAVQAAGRWPIVVGGTGLYFKALLEGLAPVPDIDPDIRNHWRGAAEQLGPQRLHDVLRARDPVMADRLRPSDSQRIVRALEVLESTGRSLAQWQAEPAVPVLAEQDCIRLVVASERGALGARIETRFDQMMADGALAEAQSIAGLRLDPRLPAMRALGLRPLLAHLGGSMDLASAVAAAKAETRAYVKRQQTWFTRNMQSWKRISAQEMECFGADFWTFIDCSP